MGGSLRFNLLPSEPYKTKNYDKVKSFWLHIAYSSPSPSYILIYDTGAEQWNIYLSIPIFLLCIVLASKRFSCVNTSVGFFLTTQPQTEM